MDDIVPVTRPRTYSPAQIGRLLSGVMRSGMYTNNGRHVRALEETLRSRLKVPNFIAMSSGTAALEAAVAALIEPDTVVAIPSFTFVAVASAVVRNRCKPIFIDIDPNTWTMSYDRFNAAEHKVGGVIVPNAFGVTPDKRFLTTRVPFIYDNAHGFGTHEGIFGDVDVYSLHATKFVGGAEGGGVACTDGCAEFLSRWRNFGYDGSGGTSCVGTNAKMSEFHAILASASLVNEGCEIAGRRRLYDRYKEKLDGYVQFQVGSPTSCVILVKNRDRLVSDLAIHGYDSRPYFYPIHKMHPYWTPHDLPHTEWVSDRAIAIPLWADMGDDVVDGVCEVILEGDYG